MTLTRDDVKSLFLSRGNCLLQAQLDARYSNTRLVQDVNKGEGNETKVN
jgi:hypothetical protein